MPGLGDLQRLSAQGSEPTYRASMLPLGTYANPDGTESLGLAMPGMIHEPLQALGRLFGTRSNPGTFGRGPDYPGNADDMRNILFSIYGGNALSPGKLAGSGVKDTAQAAYRTVRHPLEKSAVDPATMAQWQDMARLQREIRDSDNYYHGLNHVLESIGDGKRTNPGDIVLNESLHPLSTYEKAALNQTLRRREISESSDGLGALPNDTVVLRSLFSDTGRPSLFGSAVAGAERQNLGQPAQAASYYNGELFTGRNHGEAYNQAVARYGEDAVDQMLARDGMLDGFVDQHGNFMDRITANELSGGKGLNAYELLSDTGRPSIFATPAPAYHDQAEPQPAPGLGALGTFACGGIVTRRRT